MRASIVGNRLLLLSSAAMLLLAAVFCVLLWQVWRREEATAVALSAMSRARGLLEVDLYMAQRRYQMERLSDRDGDGVGEYGGVGSLLASGLIDDAERFVQRDGALIAGAYAFHVLVPAEPDAAEERFLILAQPLRAGAMRALAIAVDGAVRVAPAGFVPDPERPADVDGWRVWQ